MLANSIGSILLIGPQGSKPLDLLLRGPAHLWASHRNPSVKGPRNHFASGTCIARVDEFVFRLVATGDKRLTGAIVLHRERHQWTPSPGWYECEVDGRRLQLKVAKQYVNKIAVDRTDPSPNVLSKILLDWFGASAFARGNKNFVRLAPTGAGLSLDPIRRRVRENRGEGATRGSPASWLNIDARIAKLEAVSLAGRTQRQRMSTVRRFQREFASTVLQMFKLVTIESHSCPGCGHSRMTNDGEGIFEAHHVVGFATSKSMDPRWGIPLCPNCHAVTERGTEADQLQL